MATEPAVQSIPIDLIDPNPHRNFDLAPLDEERVDRLSHSYSTNGDFSVLSVRRHPGSHGRYQLAGGKQWFQIFLGVGILPGKQTRHLSQWNGAHRL